MIPFLTQLGLRLVLLLGVRAPSLHSGAVAVASHTARHRPQARMLLANLDPAHGLSSALSGIPPTNLHLLDVDLSAHQGAFQTRYTPGLRAIAEHASLGHLTSLHHLIDCALPGLRVAVAMLAMTHWLRCGVYDVI
ncbi:MAG: hypothetical protein AAFX99_07565, partial [Myxococcota bacterium]